MSDLLKFIIIAHGDLGVELLRSAEMIVGEQEYVEIIALGPDDSLESFLMKVKEKLEQFLNDETEAIAFVDLYGGTPSNALAATLRDYNISCIAGVNLPILLEAFLSRESQSREELTPRLIKVGKDSIVDVGARILGQS